MTDLSFTVTIGAWAIPLAITAVSLPWAVWPRDSERASGGNYGFPDIFSPTLRLIPAITLSLSSWLIWSLMR